MAVSGTNPAYGPKLGKIPLKVRNSRCKLGGSRNNDFPQPKVLWGSSTIRLCDCAFKAIVWDNVTMKKQSTALEVRAAGKLESDKWCTCKLRVYFNQEGL
jgi:hypothetical protein